MDIHRSRFVAYPSSPISALAFSRSHDKFLNGPPPALKLALGRDNGDIEIWSADRGNWVQEVVLPGGEKRKVDALAWIQEPDDTDYEGKAITGQLRLFSIGSTPAVTEWDLATGLPLRASTGNFSEVWCFAAQPRWRPAKGVKEVEGEFKGQNLVAGCGDGTLAILSTADNDLVFKRFLARSGNKKTRCMSVTWQNRDTVVAGFTDSVIRIYDTRSGSMTRQMSLGAGIPGAPKDTYVWRVKCLPDGNIVSGDSNGEVRIWDGRTYTLSQRLPGHESDCLDLVTSTDGQTIFSGGLDGRIAVYKQGARDGEKKSRWAKISHRRMHEGDIKAMAVYDSKTMSVVVSGGLDTTPFVTPMRNYNKEYHRRLPGLPQSPACVSAPKQRLLVSWWDREISVWRIYKQDPDLISPAPEDTRKLVALISVQGDDAVTSVSISEDASLLAASTLSSTKVFQLRPTGDALTGRLKVRKLSLPSELDTTGSRLVHFSPDARWLAVVTLKSEIYAARVHQSSSTDSDRLEVLSPAVELERLTRKQTKQTGLRKYEQTITRLAFSPDSRVIVASDLSGHLDSWILSGAYDSTAPTTDTAKTSASDTASSPDDSDSDSDDEDLTTIFSGQHWSTNPRASSFPKLDSAPLILSFRPFTAAQAAAQQTLLLSNGNPGVHATRANPHAHSQTPPQPTTPLLVVTAHHQLYEFEAVSARLTDWSRRNPTAGLPAEFLGIRDRVMGVVWDVSGAARRARAWLYGANWVGMLDLAQEFGEGVAPVGVEAAEGEQVLGGKKRKRQQQEMEQRKRARGTCGAGDKVEGEAERKGVPEFVTRIEDGKSVEVAVERKEKKEDGDVDVLDEEDEIMDAGSLRRTAGANTDGEETEGEDGDGKAVVEKRRKWWCTYRYRPILGMVAIGDADEAGDEDGDDNRQVEAVLVERPLWDLPHLKELNRQK